MHPMAGIRDAISFAFQRFGRLFYWLWMLLPIVGWFAFYGYTVTLIRELASGKAKEAPLFGSFGENFKTGFFYFVFSVIFTALLMLFTLIPGIGVLLYILGVLIFPILLIQFSLARNYADMLGNGFDVPRAVRLIAGNLGAYIILLLKMILIGIIAVLASLPLITILITYPAYMYATQFLLVDFFRKYSRKIK